jgi:hypothetical protein
MGLVHIFGDRPVHRVLDFFRVYQFWDFSIRDVSKATGLSYRTLQILIPELTKRGLVMYTRTEGRAKLYMFNRESPVAQRLQEFARQMDALYLKGAHKEKTEMPIPVYR